MRAGVIDIGSSSIRLLIAENDGEDLRVLESLKSIVPIGSHTFFKERIPQAIINQTIGVLEKYKQVLKEYDVANAIVIATTAVREARNQGIFIDTVLRKTGLKIEVLTPGDVIYYIDAYLSQKLKKSYPVHEKNVVIAELGAGSLEVSVMEKGMTLMSVGLPIGTLRLKQLMEKLDGSLHEVREAGREYIENEFKYLKTTLPKFQIDDVILIDESYSAYLPQFLEGKKRQQFFVFDKTDAQGLLSKIQDTSPQEIAKAYSIPIEVADAIFEYAVILNAFFTVGSGKHIYILETSLSEAIIANAIFDYELSQKYNKINQLISAAKFIARKYDVDLGHAKQVAGLSQVLFDSLKNHLGLTDHDAVYLILAAYLHDIGMFIHNRSHHKHSEYIVTSLNLFRMTQDELKMIACIGRYHRKAPPSENHFLYNSLSSHEQILVQKLSALLRIANALDRAHTQKVKKLEVKIDDKRNIALTVYVQGNFVLERSDIAEKKEMLEDITGNKVVISVKPAV